MARVRIEDKPLDWINVNKAKAIANEMLALPDDNRERTALILLRNHFNSTNKYPLEEKIQIAKMIIEDGLGEPREVEDKKQLKLGL